LFVEVFGNARVRGDAIVYGDAEITKSPVVITNLCEFNITIYSKFIQFGCKLHTPKEWRKVLKNKHYTEDCSDYEKCVSAMKIALKIYNSEFKDGKE